MKSKRLLFAAMVILLMSAFKLTVFAEDVSGYAASDIAVINKIIETNGLSGYEKDAPSTWNFVTFWKTDSSTNKKYAFRINLKNKGLSGTLDVSGMTGLIALDCGGNNLTGLNISGLTSIKELRCAGNQISSLDVSGLTNLNTLQCQNNLLTTLDLSGLSKLEDFRCFRNSELTELKGLSDCTSLDLLSCGECALQGTLNVTDLTNLRELNCSNNKLTEIVGLTNKTNLKELRADSNDLQQLDVSGCTQITKLWCPYNNSLQKITGLKDCTSMTDFRCHKCSSLTEVTLEGGKLKIEAGANGIAYITDISLAENKVTLTTEPNAGYIFDGWYTDAGMTEENKIDFDGIVSGNINLYPKFTPIISDITISDLPANITYGDNLDLAILAIQTASGYDPANAVYKWYEGENDFGAASSSYTYAVNDINEHTISCDITLGGYTATKTFTFTASPKMINTAITLAAPVRNTAPQTSIETEEYTATVVWSPVAANVFAKNTVYTATITITPKTNYTTTGIAQNGYTVSGASSNENEADSNVVKSVFPRTTGSSGGLGGVAYYNVSFETNGGSRIATQSVIINTTAKEPAAPTKEDFVFDGWYTDQKFTNKYDFSTKVTRTITLYAKWIEKDAVDNRIILTIGSKNASVFGVTKTNDVAPKVVNNRTMLPARFVAESLGANVEWNGKDKIVTVTGKNEKGENVTILITIGSENAVVNGETVKLDSPAFIENDRTYTPIRFISEKLGATVEWDGEDQTVTITKAAEEK